LSEQLSLAGSDRLLIVAPHPDDESIAAGGLLQVAKAAGAAVRVIVLTDGDNNPWPQRWVEKRWRIDAAARARWGSRRREEAVAALALLGIPLADVRFLALPDTGITDVLMRDDRDVADILRDEASSFAPTLLVAPALSDRHPDHSAAFILATRACEAAGQSFARILTFAVHGAAPQEGGALVNLSEAQRIVKYDAIRAHATQMRLSDKRFLKFAQMQESYRWFAHPAQPDAQIPIRASISGTSLIVRIDAAKWGSSLRNHQLLIVAETDAGPIRKAIMPLSESAQIVDTVTRSSNGAADVRREHGEITITLPIVRPLRSGYVKVARAKPAIWVFDRFGWQPIG
jgi:LmbE family N-acetylglucosaminyl deacetylase